MPTDHNRKDSSNWHGLCNFLHHDIKGHFASTKCRFELSSGPLLKDIRVKMGLFQVWSCVSLLFLSLSTATDSKRPNVILILTDDQDLHLNSLDYQPILQQKLRDEGTHFQKHYCTTAVCCPSRVSLLTGKLAHNTNVTDVQPPYGRLPVHPSSTLSVRLTSLG